MEFCAGREDQHTSARKRMRIEVNLVLEVIVTAAPREVMVLRDGCLT